MKENKGKVSIPTVLLQIPGTDVPINTGLTIEELILLSKQKRVQKNWSTDRIRYITYIINMQRRFIPIWLITPMHQVWC